MLPTHAGDTSRLRCSSDHPSVHPRSRGEHTSPSAAASASFGSSPLARGTLAFIVIMPFLVRLIPARAGSTFPGSPRTAIVSAHPRSRGEHVAPRPDGYVNPGSSPLTRGTPALLTDHDVSRGLIPTHAGTIRVTRQTEARTPAHPRSCGELIGVSRAHFRVSGSSPLTRGTRGEGGSRGSPARLIPARAGNIYTRPVRSLRSTAHPRSRGEHDTVKTRLGFGSGSSPLARGTHFALSGSFRFLRLIPARAGNTDSWSAV